MHLSDEVSFAYLNLQASFYVGTSSPPDFVSGFDYWVVLTVFRHYTVTRIGVRFKSSQVRNRFVVCTHVHGSARYSVIIGEDAATQGLMSTPRIANSDPEVVNLKKG